MTSLLLDVSSPTSPEGTVGLLLLTVVIIATTVALLLGFVLLLKVLRRKRSKVGVAAARTSAVPHNQP